MICAKTGWNWPSGSGQEDKKTKMLKVYNNNNDYAENHDDKRQQSKNGKANLRLRLKWDN